MIRLCVVAALVLVSCGGSKLETAEPTTTTTTPAAGLEADLAGIIPPGSGPEFGDLAVAACDLADELAASDVPGEEWSPLVVDAYAGLRSKGYSPDEIAEIIAASMRRFCPDIFGGLEP